MIRHANTGDPPPGKAEREETSKSSLWVIRMAVSRKCITWGVAHPARAAGRGAVDDRPPTTQNSPIPRLEPRMPRSRTRRAGLIATVPPASIR